MSPNKPSYRFRNRLLTALGADDVAWLQPHLQLLPLERGKSIEAANKNIDAVWFPEQGVLSMVGTSGAKSDREVEIGIIGREGVSGLAVVLGNGRSPYQTFTQIAGNGYRLPAPVLREAMERSASSRALLLKYAQAFMIQSTHTAIANARGTIEERLSRWILMAQDRVEKDDLPLTHEFLSLMLAVRRPGVTEALHGLAHKGLIRHDRGTIFVIDRDGLLECAAGLYGVPESEYKRLLG